MTRHTQHAPHHAGLGLLSARRGPVNAGRTIGQLERFLVPVFLFAGQPTAIGFVVAVKSISRSILE